MIYNEDVERVYVPLQAENESYLYHQLKNGSESARNTIIHSCLPLVQNIARKFKVNNPHVDIEDMIQEGNIALIKAVDDWDISKAKIVTVATYYVRNAIIDVIKKGSYTITTKYKITKKAAEDINKIKKCSSRVASEIAEETGLSEKRVKKLLPILDSKRNDFYKATTYQQAEEDTSGDTNISGCLADLFDVVDEYVIDEVEKKVFLSWISHLKTFNKTRMVAKETGVNYAEVYLIVRKVKKQLRGVVNA